jgi:hypothetical protein
LEMMFVREQSGYRFVLCLVAVFSEVPMIRDNSDQSVGGRKCAKRNGREFT